MALLTGQPSNSVILQVSKGITSLLPRIKQLERTSGLRRGAITDSGLMLEQAGGHSPTGDFAAACWSGELLEQTGGVRSRSQLLHRDLLVLPASPESKRDGLPVLRQNQRAMAREQGAEGSLWPCRPGRDHRLVPAWLARRVVHCSLIGWVLAPVQLDGCQQRPLVVSLPSAELDQRQQLLSRLRALQVDRGWFVELVDASQLSTEPQQDAPYRRVWTELAEQWLARIALLPPAIRAQLGRLRAGDWQQPREALLKQGVHPRVVEHLVSAGAQDLLPVTMRGRKPADPFLQLWIAAAIQSLDDVEIVRLKARPLEPAITSLPIPAGGARLVLVEAPAGDAVALGINGTPLMQMMVFGVNGQVEEERGPLRVTRIAPEAGSPLQVLVTNEGVSSSLFTLSCRADPLDQ